MLRYHATVVVAVLVAALPHSVTPPAADWPQWGGPSRDFTVGDILPATFGPNGPALRWSRPIGDGFSAIVTRGDVGYTVYRDGDADVVLAFAIDSGRTVWEHRYDAPFVERCTEHVGPAPRATPLVTEDTVFAVSAGGRLVALDRASGGLRWQKDLLDRAPDRLRPCGYSSSPLAYRDGIVVLTGVPGRSIALLRQLDGDVVWERHDFTNGYSSPLLATIDGQTQVIAFMGAGVVSVDPGSGDLLWQYAHHTMSEVNVSTPVVGDDGIVLISSAYDGGSRALKVGMQDGRAQVDEVWSHQRLRVHFGPVVRIGDMAIGASGDTAVAILTAIDVPTGRLLWRDRSAARASLIAAGGRLLILNEDGELLLATPTREGLTIDDRADVLRGTSWTPPTLVNGTVLVRNRSTMAAYALPRATGPAARMSSAGASGSPAGR